MSIVYSVEVPCHALKLIYAEIRLVGALVALSGSPSAYGVATQCQGAVPCIARPASYRSTEELTVM